MIHSLEKNSHKDWLDFLIICADLADPIALKHFANSKLKVEYKGDSTPVSEGDLEIEARVRELIKETAPGLACLGEEFEKCDQSEPYKLIIDPIDGTSNFIRGIPFFATLLAIEVKGTIVAGVVSTAATGDRWLSARGVGAFHNGKRIHVSDITDLSKSQAFHAGLYGNEARGDLNNLLNLLSKTKRQRGFGDYLMHTMVAGGCGEFSIDYGLKPWDLAPLGILVEEAGGKVTAESGELFSPYEGSIVCSNGHLHDTVISLLNQ
jgi:histidinol-phosphatase